MGAIGKTFKVLDASEVSDARRGVLKTRHGSIETPVFMPVGTQATVKSMTPRALKEIGSSIILGNTYHLNLRPGADLIERFGGLHKFMGWSGPVLTDSGGFQVFSLSKLRKVTDDGVHFRSHLDGSAIFLGPSEVMAIQRKLGSDIAMVLDECPPHPVAEKACRLSVERTLRWARECRRLGRETGFMEAGHHLFGIVQGANFSDQRRACAEALVDMDFPGYAIGGVSVGETEEEMLNQVAMTTPLLPDDRPRYVMGVGTPPQMLMMIALGIDMFDCVMPTRAARHGTAFTPCGKMNIRNSRFKDDQRPLVEGLDNYTCNNFSRAYLRHLVVAGEMLGSHLLTLHNLHFYLDLMRQARERISRGEYDRWHREWIVRYDGGAIG